MSDLDLNLRMILDDIQDYWMNEERWSMPMKIGEQTFADQIKQAFADAGYIHFTEVTNDPNWMTGQEWYKQFMEKLDKVTFLRDDVDGLDGYETQGVILAAKRAAGIAE